MNETAAIIVGMTTMFVTGAMFGYAFGLHRGWHKAVKHLQQLRRDEQVTKWLLHGDE